MYVISAPWIDFVTSLSRDFDEGELWSLLTQARARLQTPIRFIYFVIFNMLAMRRDETRTEVLDRGPQARVADPRQAPRPLRAGEVAVCRPLFGTGQDEEGNQPLTTQPMPTSGMGSCFSPIT